jgi:propanol-preferring alcohol dehydrogenase
LNITGMVIEGGTLRAVQRPLPEPTGTQVLVRVTVAGICGSDLKALHAAPSTLRRQPGLFGGHEGAGVIIATGPAAALAVGDEVLVYSYEGCQECAQCRAGEPKFCAAVKATSVGRDGTWATHMLVEAASCVRLPAGFDLPDAAVLACTGGTAAAAVLKAGEITPGAEALLIGAGPLGAAVAQLLTGLGARVHALDPNAGRIAFAQEKGWLAGPPGQRGGFPLVIETSGSEAGRAKAVESAASGAKVVFVGLGTAHTTLDIDATIRRELVLTGSHFWTLGAFPDITGLYQRAGAKPSDLVTGHYDLADVGAACEAAVTATGKLVLRTGSGVDRGQG